LNGDFSVFVSPFKEPDTSHGLLARAAMLYTGCGGEAPAIACDPQGKPYFPGLPAVCFSLTHSGPWWMCAFGGEPVGLDLQQHQPCAREKLSRRFFHPDEDAFLRRGRYEDFYAVWAAKESYIKFTGQGMSRSLSGFTVVSGGALAAETEGVQLRFLPSLPGYSLCLCARRIGEVRVLRDWS